MSSGRGKGGRTGIAGNVNVALEKEDGTNTPLPADKDDLLLTKITGEDQNGDFQRVAVDQNGRLRVKDVQFDGTVDIGDLQILNKSEERINPGTEATLQDILNNQFEASQFTETRSIEENNAGLFEASDFSEDRNVRELQNHSGVHSGQDIGGGTLASNPVPDDQKVRVQALAGNGSIIQIDGSFQLQPGQAVDLQVNDLDKISYNANSGDGICFIVEEE